MPATMLGLPNRTIRKVIALLWIFFERLGFHVTPVIYDSPVPETKDLTEELFRKRSDCIGLDWNLPVQETYLKDVFPLYAKEANFEPNPMISPVDAAVLHSMIRHHKPAKIVEIGSGWSTLVAGRACEINQKTGHESQIVSIDPYPKDFLTKLFPSTVRLTAQKVQTAGFEDILDCDVLFIDSSHVVKIGGDVNHEILEMVPRLKPGALVHWHDILLPGEYWKEWVKDRHYIWTEQYLLHAFLMFNQEFEVIWASRYMHLNNAEAVKSAFPFFEPENHHISSFWVRRKPLPASGHN